MFAPELIAAYPNAKVILTTRNVDSWYKSVRQTIYALQEDPWRKLLARLHPKAAAMRRLVNKYNEHLWWNDFPRYGKRCFREHNSHVRRLVGDEKLLEFEASQGWEPLCRFLGKDVPAMDFPRVNDTENFRKLHVTGSPGRVLRLAQNAAMVVVPVMAAIGSVLLWRQMSDHRV